MTKYQKILWEVLHMKNRYGWVSEYQRKKFLERHGNKKTSSPLSDSFDINLSLIDLSPERSKAIAVMLDLDGTSTDIDDEGAIMFVRQLDTLRKKFEAETCYISISTHYGDIADYKIRPVLNCLSRHLIEHIQIGETFYYDGTYSYEENRFYPRRPHFNADKIATFTEYYLNRDDFDTVWFALIDDNIDENAYRDYRDDKTMLIAKPSAGIENTPADNIMSISTTMKGFRGVLKLLSSYIAEIENLTRSDILTRQRNMNDVLSKRKLHEKILMRDYAFLENYICGNRASDTDYAETIEWLIYTNDRRYPTLEELKHIEKILSHIASHYRARDHEIEAEHVMRLCEVFKRTTESK